jgi:ketosteroid isomerase-like protein
MRYLTLAGLGALACLLMTTPAAAQAADPAVVAPITTFMTAFNKGDVAGAAATHAAVADLVIIDEVAPFAWHGPQAFQNWAASLAAADAKAGNTNQKVVIGAPTRVEVDGTSAYVIVPATYSFTARGGVAMRAVSQMTFTLEKGAGGWLIHGWTWTGPKASKAGAAK